MIDYNEFTPHEKSFEGTATEEPSPSDVIYLAEKQGLVVIGGVDIIYDSMVKAWRWCCDAEESV